MERQNVMKAVEMYVVRKGYKIHKRLFNGWWVHFLQQCMAPTVLRKGDSFAVVREQESSRDISKAILIFLKMR